MNSVLITIWCILGLIGWFFTYHTVRKFWYERYHKDMWKTNQRILLIAQIICFPIWIISGLLSIIYWGLCYDKKYWSLYFNIKQYEKRQKNIKQ